MKKKFWVGVSVIIMLCMFLVACSETIANSGDENTTEVTQETTEETTEAETIDEEVTTSETTENTSLGIGEQSLESYEHDLVFLSVYNSRWILGDFINAILHERIWIADYQEKFGMTFDKVYKERCELGWIMPPNEFLELPEADAVRAFYESLSLAWDIPNKFSFSGENWEEWWDDFESSEISLELDIRALKHFNITREEFERANDREIWVRLRLFERGLDIESIKSVRTFTPEEIDIIFSGDDTAIKKAALTPWTIMVEDEVYSAQWLIDHDPEEWEDAGITPDEVEESFEIFGVVLEPDEVKTFERDLKEFRKKHGNNQGQNDDNQGGNRSGQGGRGNQNQQ